MSSVERTLEEGMEELAKSDPEMLEYLEQLLAENVPAVLKTVQEVLDEPIPREMEKHKPLLPKPYRPRPPPRQRKTALIHHRTTEQLPTTRMRFWVCSMTQDMREKRVKDRAIFDGASSKVWKKTSRQTLWKTFEEMLPHHFTSSTFTRISCRILRTGR